MVLGESIVAGMSDRSRKILKPAAAVGVLATMASVWWFALKPKRKVKLDEPVRELLPPGTVAKPDGAEIRLFDLATQRSGLPRLPDNFAPADRDNPYADYGAANLYAFLLKHGVALPANAQYLYSNLGFGLLGQALSDRAGLPYPELLKQRSPARWA